MPIPRFAWTALRAAKTSDGSGVMLQARIGRTAIAAGHQTRLKPTRIADMDGQRSYLADDQQTAQSNQTALCPVLGIGVPNALWCRLVL